MEGLKTQHFTGERTLEDFLEEAKSPLSYLRNQLKDETPQDREPILTYQLSILSQLECGVIEGKDLDPQLGKLTCFDKFQKQPSLAEKIAQTYSRLGWMEHFGLNVDEVLNLPFPVYEERRTFLLQKLNEKEKEKAEKQKEKEVEKMENEKLRELLFKCLPYLSGLGVLTGSSK